MKELLNKYAPKYYFHPKEKYYPTTIDYYLEHVNLRYRYSLKKSKEILGVGQVSASNLGRQIHGSDAPMTSAEIGNKVPSFRKSRTMHEYYVAVDKQFKKKIFRGFDPSNFQDQLITYANYGRLFEHGILKGYELQYWLFFPFNGGIGRHKGDWEGIAVRTDTKGNFIYATYLGHGRGRSYLAEQIIFADSVGNEQGVQSQPDFIYSHPVVFISKSMHASFPENKNYRRWKSIIPLPADRNKRGPAFNSFLKVQLLPNRFMATGNLTWVQFGGRWGGTRSKFANSPDGATIKRMYHRGTWFRHNSERELTSEEREISEIWRKMRFEPRLPVCDSNNRWLMFSMYHDIRVQSFAELYRRDDPVQKYHNLNLYAFDDAITGLIECSCSEDNYITFEDINYGGKKNIVEALPGPDIRKIERVQNNDQISSLCWEKCEGSSWVSFFNDSNYTFAKRKLEIKGEGRFGEVDFSESEGQMLDVIRSAKIIREDNGFIQTD